MPRTYAFVKSFDLNHSEIGRIAVSPRTTAAVRDLARKTMAIAVLSAPHDEGEYRRSFRVSIHIRSDWPHGTAYRVPRVCADVHNVHPGALWIEKGSTRRRKDGTVTVVGGHHTMTRALAKMAILGKSRGKR